ncbi:amidohydrolase family protein [Mycobacteroides abscessus]|uniref:amidohydrolase family protein n=1 Tax=Mycobacteroides abscessus TaxID=36809 RepID=UPI002105A7CD|nr:amidohydrolase family protein [Mycobacteroides abscessus]
MVEKGMTPMQAITAATLSVARGYGKDDLIGSVETGKIADFVLLDADPLDDIRHLRSITEVYQAGRAVNRETLPTQPMVTTHPIP